MFRVFWSGYNDGMKYWVYNRLWVLCWHFTEFIFGKVPDRWFMFVCKRVQFRLAYKAVMAGKKGQ